MYSISISTKKKKKERNPTVTCYSCNSIQSFKGKTIFEDFITTKYIHFLLSIRVNIYILLCKTSENHQYRLVISKLFVYIIKNFYLALHK